MIVSLVFSGSIFAQHPETHWPGFYYPAYESQSPLYASIMINGIPVETDNPDWAVLEVAAFVGDELRMTSMYLTDEYLEFDLFPTINAEPIYYTTPGEEVTFKMYNHATGEEYDICQPVIWDGDPITILTGEDHWEGFDDPDHPLMLNFSMSEPDCKILVDADNIEWSEDFEEEGAAAYSGDSYTGALPECWIYEMYTGAVMNEVGEQIDTFPQIYRGFNTTTGGHYSLRMHYKAMLATPELDESVNLGNVRLSMYVRQSYWRYQLEVGVISAEGEFVPVAVVNNPDKTKTYFECGFESVKELMGEGRRIAFRNFGSNEEDLYAVNYLDDVTLTYVDCGLSTGDITYSQNFEGELEGEYDNLPTATGAEPKCWDVISEDVALTSTTKPQIYRGFNKTEGGHYSLRMMNRCIYAMPVLNDDINVADLSMTFSLRQPNSLYRLQVGVVNEAGDFTPVKTVKCNGTGIEDNKTVNFASLATVASSPGNRIAFRNTLVPGTGMSTEYFDYSYNYIDNIELFFTSTAKKEVSDLYADADADLESIDVYPNPTTGNLYIDAVGIQKVECYNQMGQLVRVYDDVVNTIDLNNLSEGVYMLRITVPQGVTMRKVVKR